MTIPTFSTEYCDEGEYNPLEELTWRALEALQAYSMYNVDAYLFDSGLNMPEQETILGEQVSTHNDYEDEDDDLGDLITHLRTRILKLMMVSLA